MSNVDEARQLSTETAELRPYEDEGERAAKRQRVAAACDECRSKKVRCDAQRPVCGPCGRRYGSSAECSWGVRKGRSAGVSKQEWMRLTRRLDELENGRQIAPDERPSTETASREGSPPLLSGHGVHDIEGNGEDNNAMMGLMEDESRRPTRHHGDSSATGFMNQLKSVIEQQVTPPSDIQVTPTTKKSVARPVLTQRPSSRHLQFLDYVLPSRQRADQLLRVYWRLVDTLYPFLDTDEVESLYQNLWTGTDLGDDGPTFLCLLNVILSIACVLDPGTAPSERVKCAETFFQRARELLNFDLIQQRSILSVQCFLLLGQYLQSTSDPQQCWIFVGLAIRVAQSLGLDLPSTSAEAPSAHRRDVLRRVWHGCVLMDRTLSMTFGRPAIITSAAAAAVPRPMAHPEGTVCQCFAEQSEERSSSSHFFIEALSLYELMSETLHILYNPASQEESSSDAYTTYFGTVGWKAIGNVLEMDTKITAWRRALPHHLNHANANGAIHGRQSRVLWLRYLHIRILLFRPVLSRFCSRHDVEKECFENILPCQIALRCSIACVKTALETISFLDFAISGKAADELDDLLPAWWYCIFYVYTSAMVLVAARLHPSIQAEVTEKAIIDAWYAVIKILKRFQTFSKYAKKCAAAVSVLFDQVPQQLDQQQHLNLHRVQRNRQKPKQFRRQSQVTEGERVAMDVEHPQNQHEIFGPPPFASPTHPPDGQTRSAIIVDNSVMRPELHYAEGDRVDSFAFNNLYPLMDGFDESATDFASTIGFVNTSQLQMDLDDMSWLSSLPSQLYGV